MKTTIVSMAKCPILASSSVLSRSLQTLRFGFAAVAAASALLTAGSVLAAYPDPNASERYDYDYLSDGVVDQNGVLLLPKDYDPDDSTLYPLVIAFHGYGEWGLTSNKDKHVSNANFNNLFWRGYGYNSSGSSLPDGNFLIFAPQAPTADWNQGGYPVKMENAIRMAVQVINEHKVDTSRIYVTGLSNGGGATWDMMYRYKEIFAAAVPVCGANGKYNGQTDLGSRLLGEHIWTFHNRNDTVNGANVGNTRNKINKIRAAAGVPNLTTWGSGTNVWAYEDVANHGTETPNLKYREYGTAASGDGHNIWSWVYADDGMYWWLRQQSKAPEEVPVGEVLLFDFGRYERLRDSGTGVGDSGRYWNSVSGTGTERTLHPFLPFAKRSTDGLRRFVNLEVTSKFNGGVVVSGTPAGTLRYDPNILRDSWATANNTEVGKILIRGLKPGALYDLTCFACQTNNAGWQTKYTAESVTATLSTYQNASDAVVLSSVPASSDGTIELEVQGVGTNAKGHIGALEIERVEDEEEDEPGIWTQDFQSSNNVSDYISSTPTPGQVNDISSGWSVNNGALEVTRGTGLPAEGITKFQLSGLAPKVAVAQFDIKSSGTNDYADLMLIELGTMTATQDYSKGSPKGVVGTRLHVKGAGPNGIRFSYNGAYVTGTATQQNFAAGQTWKVEWITNISEDDVTYTAPDNSTATINPGNADLWVGDSNGSNYIRVHTNASRGTSVEGTAMGGLRIRTQATAPVTVSLDNIDIYPLE
jgi:poly(3-hydroxybutyrate) depolymerase